MPHKSTTTFLLHLGDGWKVIAPRQDAKVHLKDAAHHGQAAALALQPPKQAMRQGGFAKKKETLTLDMIKAPVKQAWLASAFLRNATSPKRMKSATKSGRFQLAKLRIPLGRCEVAPKSQGGESPQSTTGRQTGLMRLP